MSKHFFFVKNLDLKICWKFRFFYRKFRFSFANFDFFANLNVLNIFENFDVDWYNGDDDSDDNDIDDDNDNNL